MSGFSAAEFDERCRAHTLRAAAPQHLHELLDTVRAATLAHELHPVDDGARQPVPAWWDRVATAYRSLIDEVPALPAPARSVERDMSHGVSL